LGRSDACVGFLDLVDGFGGRETRDSERKPHSILTADFSTNPLQLLQDVPDVRKLG